MSRRISLVIQAPPFGSLMRYFTVLFLLPFSNAFAADEFERAPVLYSKSLPNNLISKLQDEVNLGKKKLAFDEDWGYLPGLLKALRVPIESQMFVYSKTSLQLRYIAPKTPRAVYFNDSVYIGYCQLGDVLEISATDPQLGTVFYTLEQRERSKPYFLRQTDRCLICHGSSRTDGVPGHVVRSLLVDPTGQPFFSGGSYTVDHTTPLQNRWGGWYVTGTHGKQEHLGNLIVRGREPPRDIDNSQGHNVRSLKGRFDTGKYLSSHSDIIALMVLEHQALTHNRITKANFATRQALHYEESLKKALDDSSNSRLESTDRRIQDAGDDLLEALLFTDEARLTEPIAGTSGYTEKFTQSAIRDKKGRSLRDLDLKTRLFKYPCSYLIYSDVFDALPSQMRDFIWARLWKILRNEDRSPGFAHLSREDRAAILEILLETKAGLPSYWKAESRR